MEAGADEVVVLALVTVEDVDVDGAVDALYASVGGELPVDQLEVGLVLAVTGYPYVVALLDVGSVLHVAVDELLVDVEYGPHVGAALDAHEPQHSLMERR